MTDSSGDVGEWMCLRRSRWATEERNSGQSQLFEFGVKVGVVVFRRCSLEQVSITNSAH